jgi:hypothetical protein
MNANETEAYKFICTGFRKAHDTAYWVTHECSAIWKRFWSTDTVWQNNEYDISLGDVFRRQAYHVIK